MLVITTVSNAAVTSSKSVYNASYSRNATFDFFAWLKMQYTFKTSCGTTHVLIADTNFSDATLKSMLTDYNNQDCGEAPADIEIQRP